MAEQDHEREDKQENKETSSLEGSGEQQPEAIEDTKQEEKSVEEQSSQSDPADDSLGDTEEEQEEKPLQAATPSEPKSQLAAETPKQKLWQKPWVWVCVAAVVIMILGVPRLISLAEQAQLQAELEKLQAARTELYDSRVDKYHIADTYKDEGWLVTFIDKSSSDSINLSTVAHDFGYLAEKAYANVIFLEYSPSGLLNTFSVAYRPNVTNKERQEIAERIQTLLRSADADRQAASGRFARAYIDEVLSSGNSWDGWSGDYTLTSSALTVYILPPAGARGSYFWTDPESANPHWQEQTNELANQARIHVEIKFMNPDGSQWAAYYADPEPWPGF